jgi:hypothetical protein
MRRVFTVATICFLLTGMLCRPPVKPCEQRTGGAFITFGFANNEVMRMWFTNSTFIDTALQYVGLDHQQTPVFERVIRGRDCDPQWSWHVDPENVHWADMTIELCDATPSLVEADLASWEGRSFCPWSAVVLSVEDRR